MIRSLVYALCIVVIGANILYHVCHWLFPPIPAMILAYISGLWWGWHVGMRTF